MHNEPWIAQHGDGSTDLVAILFHGRGGQAEDMQRLAGAVGLSRARGLFPAASGSTWYPLGFLSPVADNEPNLSQAIRHAENLVSGLLSESVPAERILLGGFSQGACLTSEFIARHPRRYGGALIFTGGLIGPPGTTWRPAPALAGMPVYLSSSRDDAWVPPWRVEETAAWLRGCGADVTTRIVDERPHTVSAEEIEAARGLVARIAQPR